MNSLSVFVGAILCCLALLYPAVSNAETKSGEGWQHYGGSQHGLQYSDLTQITRDNVIDLKIAWSYRTGELGQGTPGNRGYSFQTNPILVQDKLYVTTGSSIVIALNPATGQELWRYDPQIRRDISYSESANRGVSSWIDPLLEPGNHCHHRIEVVLRCPRKIEIV